MCCSVRISSTGPTQSRPERTKSLLVRSAGTCSKQMFAPSPECVCVLLYPVFPYVWLFTPNACLCARVFCVPPPPFIPIHFVISATSSTLLLQRSVTEHLLYSDLLMSDPPERGGDEEREEEVEEEKDFMGLYLFIFFPLSLHRCHLCHVKRCKVPSPCGSPAFGFD